MALSRQTVYLVTVVIESKIFDRLKHLFVLPPLFL